MDARVKVTDQDFQDIADAEDLLLDVMKRLAARGVTTLNMVRDYEAVILATDHLRKTLNALDPQGLSHECLTSVH